MGIEERRKRERAARRKAVLDAARSLVVEHGLSGATTKRIAQRCELSEATLFWYFKNKDEIFTSLLFEGIEFMSQGLDTLSARKISPKRKLAEMWKFFSTLGEEHPEYFYIFAHLANPESTSAVADEIKSELAQLSGDNFRKFAKLIKDADVTHSPRVVADLMWGSFIGLVLLRQSRQNLGAKAHPTNRDLGSVFKLLVSGIHPLAG